MFRISYEPINSPSSDEVAPVVLNISDFTKRVEGREHWYSSPFYAYEKGYRMCISIDFSDGGNHDAHYSISVLLHLLKGPFDNKLHQSGDWPLRGVFLIELIYRCENNGYYHQKEIYFLSNETCTSCVTVKDDSGEGYKSNYIIPLKHLLAGLKNDEVLLNISYSSCYTCTFIWNWSLKDLLSLTGLCLLNGLSTSVLLIFIEAFRHLIETSNVIISLVIVEYDVIVQAVYKSTRNTLLFIMLTVATKILTLALWEFTDAISYSSATVMNDMINRTLIVLLYSQVVSVHSLSTVVISPVWMMYMFSEPCSTLLIVTLVAVVAIVNIYWSFYGVSHHVATHSYMQYFKN